MTRLGILGVAAAAMSLLGQAASANELPTGAVNFKSTTATATNGAALGGTAALSAIRDKASGSASFSYRGNLDTVVTVNPSQHFANARANGAGAVSK